MKNPNSPNNNILDLPLEVRAEMALREGVRKALEENARLGIPAYIWRDGKVVAMSPEEIKEHLAKPESPLHTLQNGRNGATEPNGESK
jgi:hypothetical protein